MQRMLFQLNCCAVHQWERGGHKLLATTVDSHGAETFQIDAVLWVYSAKRYFVSTSGTTEKGNVQERRRWKHNAEGLYQIYVCVDIPRPVEQ